MVTSSRPLVLVVDSDADTRARYRDLLALADCEVIEASDGREALTQALVQTPVLVITALRLPLIDGDALCKILRRDAATRSVSILVVTAPASASTLARIRRAGADAVLVQPVPPDALLREIERLLRPGANVGNTSPSRNVAATTNDAASRPSRTHHTSLARSFARFQTTTPPASPPELPCPFCGRKLTYRHSYIGGVSSHYMEQWDYYVCRTCGEFQYRQRTRRLRRLS